MIESDLEKECRELLRGTPILFEKLVNVSDNGWPDRTLIGLFGEVAFYELKKPGIKKPRAKQARYITHLQNRGFNARIINNVQDFKEAIIRDFPQTLKMDAYGCPEKNAKNNAGKK